MAYKAFAAKTDGTILLRPATFPDLWTMCAVAINGYKGSPLDKFLSPLHEKYPDDTFRGYYQRIALRWLNPRNISFVACPASNPEKIVGYIQFLRLGDDEGAKRQIASRKTLWLIILSWYYTIIFKIVNYLWPDRSADRDALRKFDAWGKADNAIHWKPFPVRANRWHVQSIVVDKTWQGRGIGKKLMSEVVERAGTEGVVVGLEASAEGERLYRSVGFELLARFTGDPIGGKEEGGVMMWRPERRKA